MPTIIGCVSAGWHVAGERGQGLWITVYARNAHTFAVVAGLRLDTTPGDSSRFRWPPQWQSTFGGPAGFDVRHPAGSEPCVDLRP